MKKKLPTTVSQSHLLLLLLLLLSGLLGPHFVKTFVALFKEVQINSVLFTQTEECARVIEKDIFNMQPLGDTTHSSIYSFCLERLQRDKDWDGNMHITFSQKPFSLQSG